MVSRIALTEENDALLDDISNLISEIGTGSLSHVPRHRYTPGLNQVNLERMNADVSNRAVVSIHSFLQCYAAGHYIEDKARVYFDITYKNQNELGGNGRKEVVVVTNQIEYGENHSWNMAYFIGHFLKAALIEGLDDFQSLASRLRTIGLRLEQDFSSKLGLSVLVLLEQELKRHLFALRSYYEFHKSFDQRQRLEEFAGSEVERYEDEPYEVIWQYNWSELAWNVRVGPIGEHPTQHHYLWANTSQTV